MVYKKIALFFSVFILISCAELQNVVNTLPNGQIGTNPQMIANGLRQALDFGIDKQVTKLTQRDGFYKNKLVATVYLLYELKKSKYTKHILRFLANDNVNKGSESGYSWMVSLL